jgi:hypothetical protein
MKTLYNCAAFEVVDLETPVINMTPEVLESFKFCVEVEGIRGKRYAKVSPGCVAYYTAKNGCDPVLMVERAKAKGEKLYWLNNCGSSLVAHSRPSEMWVFLSVGQRVQMAGQLLEVRHNRAEFFELVPVA